MRITAALFYSALLRLSTVLAAGMLATSILAQMPDAVSGLHYQPNQRGNTDTTKVAVTVTVQPQGRAALPTLTRQDVMVFQDRDRRPVVDWSPVQSEQRNLDLVIVIDDSLNSSVGIQFDDLRQFIRSLPQATRVAVVYATQGSAKLPQTFTTNHEAPGKALRLPLGRVNEGSSIYMSVVDLLKHWPADSSDRNRRAMLVISDGLDLYWGVTDSQPSLNTDLREAINTAQRENVTVYTLFANTAGLYRRDTYLLTNGQGSLSMLADATGGKDLFEGLETPVAFQPYLTQLKSLLEHQYVLTFEARSGKLPTYAALKVTTEQRNVKLVAPKRVYVPAPRG